MVRNVLDAKEKTISPYQDFAKINEREQNTKQQQPDMAERQPRLKRVTAGKTPNRYGEWQLA